MAEQISIFPLNVIFYINFVKNTHLQLIREKCVNSQLYDQNYINKWSTSYHRIYFKSSSALMQFHVKMFNYIQRESKLFIDLSDFNNSSHVSGDEHKLYEIWKHLFINQFINYHRV